MIIPRRLKILAIAFTIGVGFLIPAHRAFTAGKTSEPATPVGTPYQLQVPFGLEDADSYVPKDNPLTIEKVELGKLLFFRSAIVGRQYDLLRKLPYAATGLDRRPASVDRHPPSIGDPKRDDDYQPAV